MMTLKELCMCFEGFNEASRILIHFDHGGSALCKWEDACCTCYVVKRFAVTSIIDNVIVLEVWN